MVVIDSRVPKGPLILALPEIFLHIIYLIRNIYNGTINLNLKFLLQLLTCLSIHFITVHGQIVAACLCKMRLFPKRKQHAEEIGMNCISLPDVEHKF